MTDRTDQTGGAPANRSHRLLRWDMGFRGRVCRTDVQASLLQSLGFVVQMPVILLLARFSFSSIYRAVFTPAGGFREGPLTLSRGRRQQPLDQHKQDCGLKGSQNLLTSWTRNCNNGKWWLLKHCKNKREVSTRIKYFWAPQVRFCFSGSWFITRNL